MKRVAATLMVGTCLTLTGGGIAHAYPPDDTTPPTSVVSPDQGASGPTTTGDAPVLPSTGSDGTTSMLLLGAGLLGSGALLTGAVRRRRTA